MRIAHLEIANFRKLLKVRVDVNPEKTLLVGANNSGKTSAMIVLRHFLVEHGCFCTNDFTLSWWPKINANGSTWLDTSPEAAVITRKDWTEVVPTLDIWLDVAPGELHYVTKLLPTLDWTHGLLGVRLRYEPVDLEAFRADFVSSVAKVLATKSQIPLGQDGTPQWNVKLWPDNMIGFLEKRLGKHFKVQAYRLDPTKLANPVDGQAVPQELDETQEPVELEHLKSLMRIDEIDAQRGFGQSSAADGEEGETKGRTRLSAQLRSYFAKHLDPLNSPEANDLEALAAIETAERAFDERLAESFRPAFKEVEGLGYPGVTDPRITISTVLRPVEGLRHESAVKYRVDTDAKDGKAPALSLPEDFNGLGYQNLISMIFRLMSFRDAWMRVGKASSGTESDRPVPPLHLVLIEEPEAHMHAQVQQVFAKKAYEILRDHADLKDSPLTTQMIISTHSIHVAHELDFACLRYFRRLPAGQKAAVPVSTVINLCEVFGADDATQRFVARYLKAQHCDLFFADAVILVEGPAERMLVPHFIRKHFSFLNQCYVTLLEIGGSHAHRLRPLIEHLGLLTLVVTDLDSQKLMPPDPAKGGLARNKAQPPQRGAEQTTNNDTLKNWCPVRERIDDLLALHSDDKVVGDDGLLFAVRVAFQTALDVVLAVNQQAVEALPYTFEDSLVFTNFEMFRAMQGGGLVGSFRRAIESNTTVTAVGEAFFDALRQGNRKAEFALEVLFCDQFDQLIVPAYIAEGLSWLEERLRKKQNENALPVLADAATQTDSVEPEGVA